MTICVVDLSGIFWAAFMSTSDSDPASAPHDRTVGKIRRIADDFPQIGIACDHKENWRRKRDPLYKAKRAERPPQAWAQLEHTMETLRREGYPVWQFAGYEADDVMATVAANAPTMGHDVCLVTADKDLRACIRDPQAEGPHGPARPAVFVMTPGDSRAQPVKITEANCGMDKQLVPPRLIRDYLALRGDGSDNLPGVRGIGPVKALRLLLGDAKGFAGFGSYPGVVAAFERRDPALMDSAEGKAMLAILDAGTDRERMGIEDAHRTWDLAELRTDVPVDWTEALRERVMSPVPSPMRAGGEVSDADFEEESDEQPDSSRMHEQHMAAEAAAGRVAKPTGGPCADSNVALATATTALAAPVPWTMQLEPTNSSGAVKLAQYLADSRMFPSLATPEQVLAAMLLGRAHGIGAVTACMNCSPIKGRMSMSSALIVGIVQRSEVCEYIEGVDGDAKSCTWVAKRKGRPERKHTFTIQEANAAGYVKSGGPWVTDPASMLWLRCGTRIARRVFNDVISGVYSTEEMNDV